MRFEGWNEVTLGDISIGNKGSYGIAASAVEYSEDKYTYLRITDINDDGTMNTENLMSVDDKNSYKYILKPNDIVFARTGNSTGRSYFYDESDGELVYAGFLIKFSLNPQLVNPKFMKYYTLSSKYRGWVNSFASGSTRKNINAKTYSEMKINLPPRHYQDFIVSVLEKLDNKQKNNRIIIDNLEELAQTLFKHWFVDFEFPNEEGKPYKSSGGKMVESELGMIPEGWGIGNLNYFIHETMNGDWGKAEAEKNHQFPVNIIRGADLPELRFGRDGKPPKRFILEKNFKKKSLRNGDVIVEISGGSPTQSTGRTLFVDQNILKKFDNKVVSTNFCRVLRPSIEEHGIFVHTYFAYLYNNGVFFNYENGTTGIKNLDIKSVLEELKVVIPDETILNKFNSLVYILLNSIQKLGDENSKLEAIRDTLLPKLLSGEIELPDDVEVTDDVPIS